MLSPQRSKSVIVAPMWPRITASGFRSTRVFSAPSDLTWGSFCQKKEVNGKKMNYLRYNDTFPKSYEATPQMTRTPRIKIRIFDGRWRPVTDCARPPPGHRSTQTLCTASDGMVLCRSKAPLPLHRCVTTSEIGARPMRKVLWKGTLHTHWHWPRHSEAGWPRQARRRPRPGCSRTQASN
jgi:hypothetical protein